MTGMEQFRIVESNVHEAFRLFSEGWSLYALKCRYGLPGAPRIVRNAIRKHYPEYNEIAKKLRGKRVSETLSKNGKHQRLVAEGWVHEAYKLLESGWGIHAVNSKYHTSMGNILTRYYPNWKTLGASRNRKALADSRRKKIEDGRHQFQRANREKDSDGKDILARNAACKALQKGTHPWQRKGHSLRGKLSYLTFKNGITKLMRSSWEPWLPILLDIKDIPFKWESVHLYSSKYDHIYIPDLLRMDNRIIYEIKGRLNGYPYDHVRDLAINAGYSDLVLVRGDEIVRIMRELLFEYFIPVHDIKRDIMSGKVPRISYAKIVNNAAGY